jgi:hypothetical protein
VRSRWFRAVRWCTVLVLIGLAWLGTERSWFADVCSDAPARVGHVAVVRVCRPVEPTDLSFVFFTFLIVLLILPDVSEISLGIVSLRRLVEKEAEQAKDAVRALQSAVMTVVASQSQQTVAIATLGSAEDLERSLAEALGGLGISIGSSTVGVEDAVASITDFLARVAAAEGVIRGINGLEELASRLAVIDDADALDRFLFELEGVRYFILGTEMSGVRALEVLPELRLRAARFEDVISRSAALRDSLVNGQGRVHADEVLPAASASLEVFVDSVSEALDRD